MIQPCETSDVLFWNVRIVMTQDVCVSVCRVRNDDAFNSFLGKRQGFGLLNKDFLVHVKQVFSLHALFPRKSSNEHDNICVFEHLC